LNNGVRFPHLKTNEMTDELKEALEAQGESGVRKLRVRMNIASNATMLIRRYGLTEEVFCENVGIAIEDYHSFLSGTYDYRVDNATNLDFYTEELNAAEMKKRRG